MSRQSENGCIIWLGIGGFLLLINVLKENPILIVYVAIVIIGVYFFILLLNFLHTFYLVNFNKKINSILKFDDVKSREHFEKLLEVNRTEKIDVNEKNYQFISSSKIFNS